MAFPRVFVSSTCYDLYEIRESLFSFITSYSYEPVLSERGDIFYHPDLHTHESCLHEIESCQLFILIIGGRFGGHYAADPKKSIVNAEYQAAKQCGTPVFCFVKREVLEDHRLYEKNKGNTAIINKIKFPSIEKQSYSSHIFEFINEVRNSPVNNGVFSFEFGKDIEEILSKQWAGMMLDFLLKRRRESELSVATALIENLTLASKKTEELIESIYKHLDKDKAEESIKQLDEEIEAKKFFQNVFNRFGIQKFEASSIDDLLSIDTNLPWYEFLEKTGDFEVIKGASLGGTDKKVDVVAHSKNRMSIMICGETPETERMFCNNLNSMYDSFRELNRAQRKKVLNDVYEVVTSGTKVSEGVYGDVKCKKCGTFIGLLVGDNKCPNCGNPIK